MQDILYESKLDSLPLLSRGKVRDIYAVDDRYLLIVTTDRLSAFDVVLPTPIPGKGGVLTRLSDFWAHRTAKRIPNHFTDISPASVVNVSEQGALEGRAVVVHRLRPLPLEAIVRGYLIGSGWHDYQASGGVCGIRLPDGLRIAERLPEPLFTPSTKAQVGQHDQNVAFDYIADSIGAELADRVRHISVQLYVDAREYAAERGIIIADTKFEFGLSDDGSLYLIDEILTPDSSRFWPADEYRVGTAPPSFDKQYVRDYLATLDWDRRPPAPPLPAEVVASTAARYREAEQRLTASALPLPESR